MHQLCGNTPPLLGTAVELDELLARTLCTLAILLEEAATAPLNRQVVRRRVFKLALFTDEFKATLVVPRMHRWPIKDQFLWDMRFYGVQNPSGETLGSLIEIRQADPRQISSCQILTNNLRKCLLILMYPSPARCLNMKKTIQSEPKYVVIPNFMQNASRLYFGNVGQT